MIPISCKICNHELSTDSFVGRVPFSKNCAGAKLPLSPTWGVFYFQCPQCKFLFTPAFDSWTGAMLKYFIYNDDYGRVDPEFVTGERVRRNAGIVMRCIPPNTSILDFGGGDGKLTEILRHEGFSNVEYNDTFYAGDTTHINLDLSKESIKTYDFITCFEVLEHSPRPRDTAADIASLLSPSGVVFFSTHTLGPEYSKEGLEWWYIGPRSGHVSIFSREALRVLWDSVGFNVIHLTPNRHFAQRRP